MLAISILILGICSRLIIHAPNFTPVIALALFSGLYLRKSYTWSVPLLLMVISDLVIGFHPALLYTWGSIVLIAGIGVWLRQRKNWKNVTLVGIAASILFFILTNFGSWADIYHLYPHTMEGLIACYIAAIPFFRNTFISTLAYLWLFYGVYEFCAAKLRNTAWARMLLWA